MRPGTSLLAHFSIQKKLPKGRLSYFSCNFLCACFSRTSDDFYFRTYWLLKLNLYLLVEVGKIDLQTLKQVTTLLPLCTLDQSDSYILLTFPTVNWWWCPLTYIFLSYPHFFLVLFLSLRYEQYPVQSLVNLRTKVTWLTATSWGPTTLRWPDITRFYISKHCITYHTFGLSWVILSFELPWILQPPVNGNVSPLVLEFVMN